MTHQRVAGEDGEAAAACSPDLEFWPKAQSALLILK
jgi:hypothetical protein